MSGIGVRISRKRTVALRFRESSFAKYGQRGTVIFSCLVDVVSDSFRYFPALVKLCDFYRDALLQFFIATSFSSSRAAWLKLSRLRQRFLTEGQGCRSAGGSVKSRNLTDSKWRILDPLLPDRGERGPAIPDNGERSPVFPGSCATVRLGATCPSDTEQWRALDGPPIQYQAIDSTIVRAHQQAAGVKRVAPRQQVVF